MQQRACTRYGQRGDVALPSVLTTHTRPDNLRPWLGTNFKAYLETNLTQLRLNHLNHAKEGTSDYRTEQKHSIDL